MKASRKKTFMDMTPKKLIVFLLWMAGVMTAHARQGLYLEERAYRQSEGERGFAVAERLPQRAEQQDQSARRRQNGGRDELQYYPAQAGPQPKNGRLTPEERRALRRQINEAGQDIYTNGRKGGH